jgi:isopentenyldiphosphate isomerase
MELLLQHRGITESSYPDYWDQSAGGHVDEGETDLQAIRRETFEELGISINEFIFVNEFYTENRRNIIYQAAYDGSLSIDKNEVDAVKWFSLNKVLDKVNKKTLNVTPSCLDLIKYFNTRK